MNTTDTKIMQINKVTKLSRNCRILLQCAFAVIPIIALIVWFGNFEIFQDQLPWLSCKERVNPINDAIRILGFGVNFILVTIPQMIGIWILIRLFKLYEKTIFFSIDNINCIKQLSYVLFMMFFAGIIENTMMKLVLTIDNPPGQRILTIGLGTSDLQLLIEGLIVLAISYVMEEGRKLQEEQNLVI